jgi:3-oxoacyl-[acyl-carrier protein] reductase
MRLKDKVAIVTGGAKGLGRAFAIRLAEEGARIMAVTRKDMNNLKETVSRIEDIGGNAAMFQADVSVSSRCVQRSRYGGHGRGNGQGVRPH